MRFNKKKNKTKIMLNLKLGLFDLSRRLGLTVFIRFQSSREIPEVIKLKKLDKFQRILTPELRKLKNLFDKHNYELKIAGGAVRDLYLDILPHDVDLATNARPQEMLDMFDKEKIRVLNLNGIKHGTVPIRINDKVKIDFI